jgi:hypothetical protein
MPEPAADSTEWTAETPPLFAAAPDSSRASSIAFRPDLRVLHGAELLRPDYASLTQLPIFSFNSVNPDRALLAGHTGGAGHRSEKESLAAARPAAGEQILRLLRDAVVQEAWILA